MIKITKPQQAPAILRSKGSQKCAAHCADYNAGQRAFIFDNEIYGASTVKQALMKAQHGKCCYCERKVDKYDDIEHFRPKAGYQQTTADKLKCPSYYWLAYEWDNLLISCAECNRSCKKNLFPLRDPSQRAKSHTDNIGRETPMLLHPAHQDPELYITFDMEAPVAVNANPFGHATIKALGLDRPELNSERLEQFLLLFKVRNTIRHMEEQPISSKRDEIISELQELLNRAISDSGKFAGMARAAKKNDFQRPVF